MIQGRAFAAVVASIILIPSVSHADGGTDSNWSGSYAGLFAGFGMTSSEGQDVGNGPVDLEATGGTMGLLRGRNWQKGRFVFGIESDFGIHEIKDSAPSSGSVLDLTADHLWSAHLRGRLGFDMGRYLPFIAGGLVTSEVHLMRSSDVFDGGIEELAGWTLGAGIDTKITDRYVVRAEYLYDNLPDASYNFTTAGRTIHVDYDTHTLRGSLIVKDDGDGMGSLVRSGAEVTTDRWAGFYSGIFVGSGFGTAQMTQLTGTGAGTKADGDLDGYAFGTLIGWNGFYNQFLYGAEIDLARSEFDGSDSSLSTPLNQSNDLFWYGTARARLGYSYGRFLPFATAGYAISQVNTSQPSGYGISPDPLKQGWTVGSGFDVAITETLALRADYQYLNFEEIFTASGVDHVNIDADMHIFRAGAVFKLGQ